MRKYYFSIILSIFFTYSLIFIGGLVRVSGAGLGCPDWPKCFDGWIPPVSVEQIPDHIDKELFNFRLAWTEYLNRLFGVLTGFVILYALYMSFKFRAVDRLSFKMVLGTFLLTCVEGAIGGLVVVSYLEPAIVSLHLLLAFVIVSLLIYVFQRLHLELYPFSYKKIISSRYNNKILITIWLLIVFEILLGTQMREGVEVLVRDFPSIGNSTILGLLGIFKYVHTGVGFLLLALVYTLYKSKDDIKENKLIYRSVLTIYGLMFFQIFIGEFMVFFNFSASVRLLHMWLSSIIVGLITLIITHIRAINYKLK